MKEPSPEYEIDGGADSDGGFELDGPSLDPPEGVAEDESQGFVLGNSDCNRGQGDANAWQPGINVVPHISRKTSVLRTQAQVLIANVYLTMRQLPTTLLQGIISKLPSISETAQPLAAKAAAHVLRVSANTIRNCARRLSKNGWQPCDVAEDNKSAPAPAQIKPQRESHEVLLKRLVRECVHNIAHGRADEDYILAIAKLQAHGMDAGDKFASSSFLQVVEFVGAKLLQIAQLEELAQVLPGVGVLPPLALTFDTVTSGSNMFSRAETCQIIMVATISPIDGLLRDHFMSSPSVGAQV